MIPGLSKWQINQARRHAAEEGPGKPVVSEPIKQTRLHPVKTNPSSTLLQVQIFYRALPLELLLFWGENPHSECD